MLFYDTGAIRAELSKHRGFLVLNKLRTNPLYDTERAIVNTRAPSRLETEDCITTSPSERVETYDRSKEREE